MESSNVNEERLDNKYTIIKKKADGGTSSVYLVKEDNTDKLYAAKVYKNQTEYVKYYPDEKKMLEKIKDIPCPNLIKLFDSGEGEIIKGSKSGEKKKYLILNYVEKDCLFDYVIGNGLGEKLGKFLFYEILKGVQALHKANICHRDLKLGNILLDNNYNPIIGDFGYATEFKDEKGKIILKTDYLGTPYYVPPEILNLAYNPDKGYDGSKADIFSLGAILIVLVTGKPGFGEAKGRDKLYRYIKPNHYQTYWEKFQEGQIEVYSKDFKDLFCKMVFHKQELRPSIDDILNKENWLKEIRDLTKAQYEEYKKEIYEEFLKREKAIENKKKNEINAQKSHDNNLNNYKGKGIESIKYTNIYFNGGIPYKQIKKTELDIGYYTKINGNLIPHNFMNSLANEIFATGNDEDKEGICIIDESKKYLKFKVTFIHKNKTDESNINENDNDIIDEEKEQKEGKEQNEEEEHNEEIEEKFNTSKIEVKLFGSFYDYYIIRFIRKEGNMFDFYNNIEMIRKMVEKLV